MFSLSRFFVAFFVFCAFTLSCGGAQAALLFCNHTKDPIEAAVGYREGADWISEGWWQIKPGLCTRVYGKPLTQRFYFYFARSLGKPITAGKGPKQWQGKYAFCIDKKAFRILGDGHCEEDDYQTQGFHEIDLGPNNARDYTLNF